MDHLRLHLASTRVSWFASFSMGLAHHGVRAQLLRLVEAWGWAGLACAGLRLQKAACSVPNKNNNSCSHRL